jgi:hypothetical protein
MAYADWKHSIMWNRPSYAVHKVEILYRSQSRVVLSVVNTYVLLCFLLTFSFENKKKFLSLWHGLLDRSSGYKDKCLRPGDGGSKYLWNVDQFLLDYTARHPVRHSSSYSPPWEPEISRHFYCHETSDLIQIIFILSPPSRSNGLHHLLCALWFIFVFFHVSSTVPDTLQCGYLSTLLSAADTSSFISAQLLHVTLENCRNYTTVRHSLHTAVFVSSKRIF